MSLKVSFNKARNLIVIVFLVVLSFGGGYYLGVQGFRAEVTKSLQVTINRQVPPNINANMDLFWNVWQELENNYYDKSKLDPSSPAETRGTQRGNDYPSRSARDAPAVVH